MINQQSAGGVIVKGNKVLLIHWESRNTFELPKGTIKKNEVKENTAIREVFEETGYKTKIIKLLGKVSFIFDWDDGKKYKKTVWYFLMKLNQEKQFKKSLLAHEDFETLWLPFEKAIKIASFGDIKKILHKAQSKVISYSLRVKSNIKLIPNNKLKN